MSQSAGGASNSESGAMDAWLQPGRSGLLLPHPEMGVARTEIGSGRVRKRSKSECLARRMTAARDRSNAEPQELNHRVIRGKQAKQEQEQAVRCAQLATKSEQKSLVTSHRCNSIMLASGVLIVWVVYLCFWRADMQFSSAVPTSELLLKALNHQGPLEAERAHSGATECQQLFRGSLTSIDDIAFQLNLLNPQHPNMTDESQLNLRHLNITDEFGALNGLPPPGRLFPVQGEQVLLDIINSHGQRVLMLKSVRLAGTRVGIHVHPYGGYVLILKGEVTDFIEGQPTKVYGPNTAYYMPACTLMSVANLGTEDVELVDLFVGPRDRPYVQILESGWTWPRTERFTN